MPPDAPPPPKATAIRLAARLTLLAATPLLTLPMLLAGCEIQRPAGAYDGGPLPSRQTDTYDAGEAGFAEEDADLPDVTVSFPDAGDSDAQVMIDPLDALQGDYLLRFDSVTKVNNNDLGTVTTTSTGFGVMRVVRREDGTLFGVERLCHMEVSQDATKGEVSTSIPGGVWKELASVERELSVDIEAGTWSSAPATRRQGWTAAAGSMPTSLNAPAAHFRDDDNNGFPGVASTVDAMLRFPVPASARCTYDIISFSTTRQESGKLKDGLLASAEVKVDNSKTLALRVDNPTLCSKDDINDAPAETIERDTVRLSRVAERLLADPSECPSKAAFRAALP